MTGFESTKRILVADDDPIFLDLFEASLAASSFEVVAVGDGAEAMLSLEAQPFDMAVIDVDMPIIDGVRLIALIRATPHLRTLPIVVITSMRSSRIKDECLRMGADDFMTKPVDWGLLAQRLEGVLGAGMTQVMQGSPAEGGPGRLPASSISSVS